MISAIRSRPSVRDEASTAASADASGVVSPGSVAQDTWASSLGLRKSLSRNCSLETTSARVLTAQAATPWAWRIRSQSNFERVWVHVATASWISSPWARRTSSVEYGSLHAGRPMASTSRFHWWSSITKMLKSPSAQGRRPCGAPNPRPATSPAS